MLVLGVVLSTFGTEICFRPNLLVSPLSRAGGGGRWAACANSSPNSPPIRAAFGGRRAPSFTSYEMETTRITSPALYLPSVLPSRDTETLIGLPRPIHESVKTLKQVRHRGQVKQPGRAAGCSSLTPRSPCSPALRGCSEEGSDPWGSRRGGEIFGQDHQGPRGTAGHQVCVNSVPWHVLRASGYSHSRALSPL